MSPSAPEIEINEKRMKKAIETLKSWRDKVNEILEEEFEDHITRAEKIHAEGSKMVKYLKEYTLRSGKRVRPACVIAGYKAVGGEKEEIFSVSTAMEALQTYLLIHDDVMDKDDLRRGGPSLHKMYEKHHKKNKLKGDAIKFGESMAITAGDLANSFAVNQIVKSSFPNQQKMEALKKFEKIHRHTGLGQALDVTFNYKGTDQVKEKDTDQVYKLKTAHYTMAGPLELGATLGEGTKNQKKALRTYGMKVGRAFQLSDDLLVLYGDEEKLGKKIGTDLEEGNKTIPILKAYEMGNKKQKNQIKKTVGKKNLKKEDVKKIQEIIEETGAYQYCKEKVEKQVKEGKEAIKQAKNLDPEMKEFLLGIADYIIARER